MPDKFDIAAEKLATEVLGMSSDLLLAEPLLLENALCACLEAPRPDLASALEERARALGFSPIEIRSWKRGARTPEDVRRLAALDAADAAARGQEP